ncbi:hypothetical protein NP493_383g03039 [Ridgeia piscesae]|uniref:Carboxylesterase type B domain-containing protein n=1 Tax=Ridgeia piscesae TaxID=27915 RepID=A0AAD9NTG0_RIDPI|nr:hypothetical protein NP493_383g03039 [Ridgeia piscesae]
MPGVIRGRVVKAPQGSKVNEYLGIPFARPPVGDLRYRDPVRLDKLPTDPYEATDQKYSCMQLLDTRFGSFEGSAMWNAPIERREDCLYLNVWTPRSRGKKAVMVYT